MSLIPPFEIGLWNAWIFMLYFLLLMPLILVINKDPAKRKEFSAEMAQSMTKNRISRAMWLVYILAFIYSVFLPLKLGAIWFYIGLPIALIGLVLCTIATVNIATTPFGEPFTKGLYHYSRHPMYVTQPLILVGVSIASASGLFLLFSIVYSIVAFVTAIPEERHCLEMYGDSYREYMNKTPRWIGIPKSAEK